MSFIFKKREIIGAKLSYFLSGKQQNKMQTVHAIYTINFANICYFCTKNKYIFILFPIMPSYTRKNMIVLVQPARLLECVEQTHVSLL